MDSKELTCTTALIPSQHEYSVYCTMAEQAASSKFFNNLGGTSGIATIMLYARELGIPPMQAITGGLHNIQGKIEMSSRMINSRIRQAGHRLEVRESTDTVCRIHGKRSDTGEEREEVYTIEMAKKAGLVKAGGNWEKVPEDMLFARCISRLGRRLFPDVLGTAYAEGEVSESAAPLKVVTKPSSKVEPAPVPEPVVDAELVAFPDMYEQIKSDIEGITNAAALKEFAKRWKAEINSNPRAEELKALGKLRLAELEAAEASEHKEA